MEAQTIINVAIGLAGGLGGWILNNLKSSIDELRKADMALTDKVQHMIEATLIQRISTNDEGTLGCPLLGYKVGSTKAIVSSRVVRLTSDLKHIKASLD